MRRVAKSLKVTLVGGLLAVSFFPAVAFAQRGRGAATPQRGRCGEIQMDEQTVLDVSTEILHLTDAQKQQVQTIFDAAVKTATPIAAQMENSENSLFDAVKAGKSDAEIDGMATQQGSLRGQMLQLQAETFSKMRALLTSEQKSEAGILIYDGIGQFLARPEAIGPTNLPPANLPGLPPSSANPR